MNVPPTPPPPALDPPPPGGRNALWARTLLDTLARCGVRQVVVAPGSRSTPLVLALAEDARFETAVQIDERSAAFLALGAGKATGVPAAVITTSGTAVANLLPAVVEASQSGVPLLLLTADRPPRLRGADANQAIVQPGIFGGYLRMEAELSPAEFSERTLQHLRSVAARAVAAAVGDPAGPVHLNLPFEKPLEPDGDAGADRGLAGGTGGAGALTPSLRIHPNRPLPPDEALEALSTALEEAAAPLLVAGPLPRPWEAGPSLLSLARALGAPLLADPLSGARLGRGQVQEAPGEGSPPPGISYDFALRTVAPSGPTPEPDLILRFGATPSSATLAGWLARLAHVPQVVIDPGGRWKDHLGVATEAMAGDPARVARWLEDRIRSAPARLETRREAREAAGGATHAWRSMDAAVANAVARFMAGRAGEEGGDPRGRAGRNTGADKGAEAAADAGSVEEVEEAPPLAEGLVAMACARHAVDREALLFVSNSMPVRDLDALWPVGSLALETLGRDATLALSPSLAGGEADPGALLEALGNRGASGIDGITSTALGVAWGSGRRVVALLGDLALLHDLNGLLRAHGSGAVGAPRLKVDFVVVNNDGGGIFHLLPVRNHEPHFTPFVATPHGLEPSRMAALHGLPFRRIEARGTALTNDAGTHNAPRATSTSTPPSLLAALESALAWAASQPGSTLLEVRSDRNENHRAHEALHAAVAHALEGLLPAASPSGVPSEPSPSPNLTPE